MRFRNLILLSILLASTSCTTLQTGKTPKGSGDVEQLGAAFKNSGVRYYRGDITQANAPDTTFGSEIAALIDSSQLAIWDRQNEVFIPVGGMTISKSAPSGAPATDQPRAHINITTGQISRWNGSTWTPYSAGVDGSETKINAGAGVSVTGTGTVGDPYIVNSTGGASDGNGVIDSLPNGTVNINSNGNDFRIENLDSLRIEGNYFELEATTNFRSSRLQNIGSPISSNDAVNLSSLQDSLSIIRSEKVQTVYIMPDNGLYRGPFLEEINQYITDSSITLSEGDVIRYTRDSIILHSKDTILADGRYNAFPAMAVTKTGKVLVAYMSAAGHGVKDSPAAIVSSLDGGRTWSEPDTVLPTSAMKERYNIHDLFVTGNNDIYAVSFIQDSTISGEYTSIVLKSEDDAATWNIIDTLPSWGAIGPIITTFIVLENGDWVCGYYVTGWSAGYAWSSDEGKTWNEALYSGQAGFGLNEQYMRLISKDTILTILRAESGGGIYYSKSGDGGRTWSAVSSTGLTGGKRCFPHWAKLNTGEIFLSYRENAGDSEHYLISISEDDALTWSDWYEVDSTGNLMYAAFKEVTPGNLIGVHSLETTPNGAISNLYFSRHSSLKKTVTNEWTYIGGSLVQTSFDYDYQFPKHEEYKAIAREYTTIDTTIELRGKSVIVLNERSEQAVYFSDYKAGESWVFHVFDDDQTNTVFADSIYCYDNGALIHIDALEGSYSGILYTTQDTSLYFTPCPPGYDYTPVATTPATYSPFAWYDATKDTLEYANGATVDTIYDQSGNNRHFLSAGSAEPIFETNSFAGEASYYFNDNTDYATTSNSGGAWDFLHTTEGTVFIIAQLGGSANPDSLLMLFGPTTTAQAGGYFGLDDRSGSSRNNALFMGANNGTGGQTAFAITQVDSLVAGQFNYVQYRFDADNGTAANRVLIRINEGPEWGNNSSTNTAAGTFATLRLNSDLGGGFGGVSKICEMVFYDSALTPAQIVNLRRDYFGPKYNLTLE